ncbi:MAG: hypothetical protein MRJ96_16750 [Nitrospirales bacterium]|nr:hypothetical protein [Nitrospira sp.]MDR4503094.1 hypothetical protein [Nitrospirales bacterium]
MRTLADYKVLLDHSFTLSASESHTLTFELPSDTALPAATGDGTAVQRPIIMFMADPTNDANGLNCEITINGDTAISTTFNEGVRRTMHESIGGNRFLTGKMNSLQFSVIDGTGSVSFSDVVVWFQRS